MGENAGVKMATSPASDAYHPSNNNHNDIDNHVAINLSTSPKQPPATQPLQPKSHSPTNQPDAAPTDKPIANPLDGVGIQNVAESFATERANDHHESSIKLKRCKHGRIKVKDLSKKRLGQNSDNEATTAQNSKNESNNNHIASSIKINDDIINKDIIKTDNASSNDLSNDRLSGPSIEATRPPRNRSGTPLRKTAKHESPTRKSRISRSPSRDRSSSRERSRSSRHRRDSPRRRSGIQSRRSRRKTKRSRTPERDSYSNSYRYHRRSRSSTSSRRSRSPPHQEMNHRHRRRIISRSPSRERINRDRCSKELNLSNNKEDIFDKLSHCKSPKDRESETATLDTRKVDRSAISQNQHGNHTSKPELSSQSSSKPTRSAPQRTLHTTLGPNFLPKLAQADPDPRDNLSTRSPTTPSKGDSAASDIYDPEEPILPISPVESPPIVERGGDDDVPSSAVQLNQQEKYLQKFHRQERVVEEVKIALRPFYQNRTINKEQYKDVLRKAVPKICHSKDGEINPVKIRFLVDAYVKKMG